MAVKVHQFRKQKLKSPILIEGFPGMGLVGTISASYIVEKLKMAPMGFITSERFPPLSAVHGKIPLYPARIYCSEKYNLIVFISEFVIPLDTVHELSDSLFEFAKKNNVSQIISLGGITIKGEQDTVYAIASTQKLRDELSKFPAVKLIEEGATTGVTGVLLARGAIDNFPVASLLAESHEEYIDPKAASMVLEIVHKLVGIEIDTRELEREAKLIEGKMRDMMGKAKMAQQHYRKTEAEQSLGPMYG